MAHPAFPAGPQGQPTRRTPAFGAIDIVFINSVIKSSLNRLEQLRVLFNEAD
jgi:hypothetical protein